MTEIYYPVKVLIDLRLGGGMQRHFGGKIQWTLESVYLSELVRVSNEL
jgi:hypothetical protein